MILVHAATLACLLTLHPGHSTRVEVQWNEERQSIELAMRIDHADLESALRKRLGAPVTVEGLTAEQAELQVGRYLRDTIRVDGVKPTQQQFSWIGWERKRISSWIYVELSTEDNDRDSVELKIMSLLEVEPELNHVVMLRQAGRQRSVVLSIDKPVVTISKRD
jgi:hypothetical protein